MARKQLGVAQSAANHLLTRADGDARYTVGTRSTTGSGAPAGTGTNGDDYWDTTNKRLYMSDGGGWICIQEPWQTYTPTTTNVTLGTGGTSTGRYQRLNGNCRFTAKVTLGTVGGTWNFPQITIPFAAANGDDGETRIQMTVIDVSASDRFYGRVGFASSTVLSLFVLGNKPATVSGFTAAQSFTSSAPFAVGAGDTIFVGGEFQMSNIYA